MDNKFKEEFENLKNTQFKEKMGIIDEKNIVSEDDLEGEE